MEEWKKHVKCTELSECGTYSLKDEDRLTYRDKSPAVKAFDAYAPYYGIQCLMNKFKKICGWRVVSQSWNSETKSFDSVLMENAKIIGTKHTSYEDICKMMWWHSFEIIGPDTIKPDPFTFEEREAVERPLVEETNRRIAKWLKEHPEEAAKLEAEKQKANC